MSEPFPQVVIPHTEIRMLASSLIQQEYKIFVALPEEELDPEKKYPVLYLLDATALFGCVTQIIRLMQVLDELPEMLIVGIAYPPETYKETLGLRARDYTPTTVPSWYEKILKTRPYVVDHGRGGASKFLKFIQEELIPFIETHYPVDSQDRTIAGGSLSGLFVLYSLLQFPDTFHRYIAISPSLWWDEGVLFEIESEFTKNNRELHAKVFMSIGALEDEGEVLSVEKLAAQLRDRAYEGLELETCVFEDETHLSVVPGAISRGLRVVYG